MIGIWLPGSWLGDTLGFVPLPGLYWPLVALILEGDGAIDAVRLLNGATDGRRAAPGSVRGDFSLSNRENLVHASDSPESADREFGLWFPSLA